MIMQPLQIRPGRQQQAGTGATKARTYQQQSLAMRFAFDGANGGGASPCSGRVQCFEADIWVRWGSAPLCAGPPPSLPLEGRLGPEGMCAVRLWEVPRAEQFASVALNGRPHASCSIRALQRRRCQCGRCLFVGRVPLCQRLLHSRPASRQGLDHPPARLLSEAFLNPSIQRLTTKSRVGGGGGLATSARGCPGGAGGMARGAPVPPQPA